MVSAAVLATSLLFVPWLTANAHVYSRKTCPSAEDDEASLSVLRAKRLQESGNRDLLGDHTIAVDATKLKAVHKTGANYVYRNMTGNPAGGPFNKPCPFKDCGGWVWASNGGPGNFAEATPDLDPDGGAYGTTKQRLQGESVGSQAAVDQDAMLSCVFFHILPNGTHPWHVHEMMNEFVNVVYGSGVIDIMDPESQRIFTLPVLEGHVLTLPMGFMHMFRASSKGLHLVAFGNVLGATLALLPTFLAVVPEPLRDTVLGRDTAATQAKGWSWPGEPGSGPAMICEQNSDFVQKVIDSGGYQECSFEVTGPDFQRNGQNPCQIKNLSARSDALLPHTFITFENLNGPNADCIADGAWCTILDKTFGFGYTKLVLKPRQVLVGLMPSGAMVGLAYGKAWIAFYHPNNAYLLQFEVDVHDLFYIPANVYVVVLSLEDTKDMKLLLGIQQKQQMHVVNGYQKMRVVPLSAPLQQMDELVAAAAFYPNSPKTAQEGATKASPLLDKPSRLSAPLIYSLSPEAFEKMKSSIKSWTEDFILCTSLNSFCICRSKDCSKDYPPGLPTCAVPAALLEVSSASKSNSSVRPAARSAHENPMKALVEENQKLKDQSLDLARRNEALEQAMQGVMERLARLEQSAKAA